jgi:hypothetical protein
MPDARGEGRGRTGRLTEVGTAEVSLLQSIQVNWVGSEPTVHSPSSARDVGVSRLFVSGVLPTGVSR